MSTGQGDHQSDARKNDCTPGQPHYESAPMGRSAHPNGKALELLRYFLNDSHLISLRCLQRFQSLKNCRNMCLGLGVRVHRRWLWPRFPIVINVPCGDDDLTGHNNDLFPRNQPDCRYHKHPPVRSRGITTKRCGGKLPARMINSARPRHYCPHYITPLSLNLFNRLCSSQSHVSVGDIRPSLSASCMAGPSTFFIFPSGQLESSRR